MSFTQEHLKVVERAIDRMNVSIVGHVIAIIFQRGRAERQQPNCGNAQLLEIVQLLGETTEIADPIVNIVIERTYVKLVNNGVFIPQRIVFKLELFPSPSAHTNLPLTMGCLGYSLRP